MTGDRRSPRAVGRRTAALVILGTFLAVMALRVLSYRDDVIDRDEAYWASSAMRMRDRGLPLYVAGWDTKPPAIFLFYRACLAVAPESPMLAAHIGAALLAALAASILAATGLRLGGVTTGALAGVLFAFLDSAGTLKSMGAATETMAYVPVAALSGFALVTTQFGPRRFFIVGVLAGLAFLSKHPAALFGPAAVLVLALRDPRSGLLRSLSRAAVWVLLGSLTPIALSVLGSWAGGGLRDYWSCNVLMVLARAAHGMGRDVTGSLASLDRLARANPVALLGIVALALRLFWVLVRSRRLLRLEAGLLVLTGSGLVAALAGGYGFAHYMRFIFPPAALAAALGLGMLLSRLGGSRPLVATGLVVVAVAVLAIPDRRRQWRSQGWATCIGSREVDLGREIRKRSRPDEAIWVWGDNPEIYVVSGRRPATRFIVAAWLTGDFAGDADRVIDEGDALVPGSWDLLSRDLAEDPPAVVVDLSRSDGGRYAADLLTSARMSRWLAENYRYVDHPGMARLFVREDR